MNPSLPRAWATTGLIRTPLTPPATWVMTGRTQRPILRRHHSFSKLFFFSDTLYIVLLAGLELGVCRNFSVWVPSALDTRTRSGCVLRELFSLLFMYLSDINQRTLFSLLEHRDQGEIHTCGIMPRETRVAE
jgi:hypothetical protein